jgi:hypothetical protein
MNLVDPPSLKCTHCHVYFPYRFQTRGSSPQIRFPTSVDARGHSSSLQEDGRFIVSCYKFLNLMKLIKSFFSIHARQVL